MKKKIFLILLMVFMIQNLHSTDFPSIDYNIDFNSTIIKYNNENENDTRSLRLYMYKVYNSDGFQKYLGKPVEIVNIDKYENYNSSEFMKIIYEGMEIIFIKDYGQWEIFKISINSDKYSTFSGLSIGDTYGKVFRTHGQPYRQEVLEPGLLRHSYITPDEISYYRDFLIELAFIYEQEAQSIIVKEIQVLLFPIWF